ncbi:MAG: hypothetical protein U0835_04400 [Isosphaeraceae bacterium]
MCYRPTGNAGRCPSLTVAPADDPELQSLLRLFVEAEDRAESLRAGLALTICLLTRNYHLSADHLRSLLSFPAGDPRLSALQESVDRLAWSWIQTDDPSPAAESRPRKSLPWRLQLSGWLQRFGLWTT